MFFEGNEFWSENTRKSMDIVNQLFNISFDGFQKMGHLQLDVSKKNFGALLNAIKDAGKIDNLEDVYDKFNKYTNDTLEQSMENFKLSYEVFNNTQEQCNELFKECLKDTEQNFFDVFKYTGNVDNYQHFVDTTNQTVKNMNEFALKSSNFAQEHFNSMINSFMNETKQGKESQKK
jgi:hypothetical protein